MLLIKRTETSPRRTVLELLATGLSLTTNPQGATSTIAYRADVDGLRAVAAISVVLAHAGWLPGGTYGVDIFFVISGFLISGIILNALRTADFSFIDFYARRVKRIFPALITVLATTWGLGWFVLPSEHYTMLTQDIAASAVFAQNLWMYFGPRRPTNLSDLLLAHLWTLGIEEQFYLAWPLLLWVAARLKATPAMIGVAVAISLFSFNWLLFTRHIDPSWNNSAALLFPWNRLWELALGGLLAFIEGHTTKTLVAGNILNRSLGTIGATLILACLLAPVKWRAGGTCMAATGSLLLIAAGPQYWINHHILSMRSLVFVGLISYPLYLWHQPLLRICDILYVGTSLSDGNQAPPQIKIAAIVATFLLSYLTYKNLELPLRRSKRSYKKISILLCFIMACCGGGAYLASVQDG